MHLIDIVGKDKDQRRKSTVFPDKPSFLKRITRSIVARINIQFWKSTIPFGSINPESRIFLWFRSGATTRSLVLHFLRFRSGASTRSLVFFYDSVREYQPGVSYFPYDSIQKNVTIFRIKVLEENSKKKIKKKENSKIEKGKGKVQKKKKKKEKRICFQKSWTKYASIVFTLFLILSNT